MQEEASFFQAVFGWFKDNFEWVSWVVGGVVYVTWKIHHYFSGLNRVADEVAKLNDPNRGVMMKQDVLETIRPVLENIAVTNERLKSINERLDRIEDRQDRSRAD